MASKAFRASASVGVLHMQRNARLGSRYHWSVERGSPDEKVAVMSKFPLWSDSRLSTELPEIRAAGEGPKIEFKERFPEHVQRLAHELAAFGTSGGGTLFIGINDGGDLVGVEAPGGDARDDLVERAQGIVGTIRPSLHVNIAFAVESAFTVLAIVVPAQDEPVFYCDHRPYIRDGRRSRPASPDEVKESVWSHPSSEFRRQAERIQLQQLQDMVDSGSAMRRSALR